MRATQTPYNLWLARYAKFVAGSTFLLIIAGALVTSTDSGLSVPDWPLSFGQVFPPMVGGVFYEHGHRMIATFIGMLTIGLAVWMHQAETRRWVRNLGWVALLTVIAQGVLGGLTVLFLLPTPISVAHASLAQTYFCLMVSLALITSREWGEHRVRLESGESPSLRTLCILAVGAVYLQLVLGAIMRHMSAGLAIPDFPLAFGKIIPEFADSKIAVHFSHRVTAVLVTIMISWLAARIMRRHGSEPRIQQLAVLLILLVIIQVTLGAMTIWTQKDVLITTAHVANGALILAMTWLLTMRVFRCTFPSAAQATAIGGRTSGRGTA